MRSTSLNLMTMLSDCHAQIPTGPGQPRLFPPRSWTILTDSSPLATRFATIPLPDTVEPLWPPIFQTTLPEYLTLLTLYCPPQPEPVRPLSSGLVGPAAPCNLLLRTCMLLSGPQFPPVA